MTAQDAERWGRQEGARLAKLVQMPRWPEDTPVEEHGSLWNEFLEALVDQCRIELVRNYR